MFNFSNLLRHSKSEFRTVGATACLVIIMALTIALMVVQGYSTGDSRADIEPNIAHASDDTRTGASNRLSFFISCLIVSMSLVGVSLAAAYRKRGSTTPAPLRDIRSLRVELDRCRESYQKARMTIRALQDQLLVAQEEERRQISRDLHDSTLNHIAATGLTLMRLELAMPASSEARAIVDQAKSSMQLAAKELRALTYLMHPPALEAAGLRATTEQFAAGFSQRTGIRVRLRFRGALDTLPFDAQCCAFRVLQEALSNVHRHAKASEITIYLANMSSHLLLMVNDNGRGFPQSSMGPAPRLGVGIPGMRIRLQRMGGFLKIKRLGIGTSVRAYIPLEKRKQRLALAERNQRAA